MGSARVAITNCVLRRACLGTPQWSATPDSCCAFGPKNAAMVSSKPLAGQYSEQSWQGVLDRTAQPVSEEGRFVDGLAVGRGDEALECAEPEVTVCGKEGDGLAAGGAVFGLTNSVQASVATNNVPRPRLI